jgi:riboflavin synthase
MFSGIVDTTGTIIEINDRNGCRDLIIEPKTSFSALIVGESIAVNGVCLTVTLSTEKTIHVTAVPETLRLTNLSRLSRTSKVNLEQSLKCNSRMGGHFVQGHVDGIGKILEITHDNRKVLLVKISIMKSLTNYIVKKGYITIDGMSITVIDTADEWFTVTFIPHTQKVTITNQYQIGSLLNIEVDILGKYIEKQLKAYIHAQTI